MTRFANLALAAVTSIGLALSPIQASAAPDGEDYAKIIGGLAVLGLIANAAKDKDRRTKTQLAETYDRREPRLRSYDTIDRYDDRRDRRVIRGEFDRPGLAHSRFKDRFKLRVLPERCVRILRTSRGDRLVYGRQCLNRHYRNVSLLPEHCERRVRTERGVRTVYGARCLRRDGWRVAVR